jgi:tetratricopeptide (TPR) repeat protein
VTPERWARIEDLFHASLERTGQDRHDFLRRECQDDAALRDEVVVLLDAAGDPLTHLQRQIQDVAARVCEPEQRVEVGAYRMIRQIGRGGMGEVYLAERREDFTKQVALKLVRPGLGQSEELLARFFAERQILASLDHPNIARLLDGGLTHDGVPYLVMEYIDGTPVDEYVREHRLDIRQRISLFRPVCQAVQHAHRNLVVHRDLKPSNILVTREGVPKLLDFGIAKLIDEGTPLMTRASERVLTPEYASPEQVQGLAITTASDVYALGILLYEILTNRRPFDISTMTPFELSIAICEREPVSPGSVVAGEGGKLDADLDSIVLKAMRKEPGRRFASAAELDADLERWLGGYPVAARQGTWRYKAGKYVRRNRVVLAASALIAGALFWGGISTYIAQQKAAHRFAQVRELANRFLFEFEESIERLPGATPARALVVKRGLEYLDGLARESSGDPDLEDELARGYEKLRIVQYGVQVGHLGDVAGAEASARKAAQLREAILAARPRDPKAIRDLAYARQTIGQLAFSTGKISAALPALLSAEELGKRAVQMDPHSDDAASELAGTTMILGQLEVKRGNAAAALGYMNSALAIDRRLLELKRSPDRLNDVGQILIVIGDVYRTVTGEQDKAAATFRQALALQEERLKAIPQDAGAIHDRDLALQRVGLALSNAGDYRGALPYLNENLAGAKKAAAEDPASSLHRRVLSVAEVNLADALMHLNDTRGSIELAREAVDIRRGRLAAAPGDTQARDDLSNALFILGSALDQKGSSTEAWAKLEESRQLRDALVKDDPSRADIRIRLGRIYLAEEKHSLRGNDCGAARREYEKAKGVFDELVRNHRMAGTDLQYPKEAESLIGSCGKTP